MHKQLRKPANWQDFEQLCKRLWGEIWRVPYEIKLHGRSGQAQHGVDICAVPQGQLHYWGIQCKLKDESTGTQLTKAEVEAELTKAHTFSPPLAGFIIATTANKDVALEQAVRELDLTSRQTGGPIVQLYCWEDIVGLLDQYPPVLNWYLTAQQVSDRFDFTVRLTDGQPDLLRPEFTRRIRLYEFPAWDGHPQERPPRTIVVQGQQIHLFPVPPNMRGILDGYERFQRFARIQQQPLHPMNLAVCPIEFQLTNTGTQVLENRKVQLDFQGELKTLSDSRDTGWLSLPRITPIRVEKNNVSYRGQSPLVQGDTVEITLYLLPLPKSYKIPVRWKLLARDYSREGELLLTIKPKYSNEFDYVAAESPEQVCEPEVISVTERLDE